MKMFSHIKLTKELTLLLFTFGIIILLYFALPDYYYGALYVQAQLQQQRQQPPPIMGIKITSPVADQVPVGELTISGISTDNATSDCTVYADWNNTKPFQKAVATGPGGINDYSRWNYTYTDKYHLITNGTNNLTSKLSCISSPANLTKWNSLNVIGLASDQNQQQPLPIKVNSTTLGNGTILGNGTSNTAALGVGAENGDSSDLLPRPIVTEQKQNNLSGSSRISTSLSPVKGDNNGNNGNKTATRTATVSESIPSIPITPSPDPSSPPFTQKQQEEEPQPEIEPQPEDNGDTTLYWDMEEAQDRGNDNEQVFDFEGNIFD